MRSKTLFPGCSRWLFSLLLLMACGGFALGQVTTFTGKVYSPNGPTTGDPIPNILVFIADPNSPLPVFSQGVVIPTGTQTGCEAQPSLVPASNLGEALTDYTGSYTFQSYGALPTPTINVVIQAGKWRLQTQIQTSTLTQGGVNTLPPLSMPSSSTAAGADLPHIAVVTGDADAIECIFNQIGISNSEITDVNNSSITGGSIDLYEGEATGGQIFKTPAVSESTLMSSVANLAQYDLVMFGCQGGAGDTNTKYNSNLVTYTSDSGRIFATHYGYVYLENNGPFNAVADWTGTSQSFSSGNTPLIPATINNASSFPQGVILANWLNYINALESYTPTPTVGLTNVRVNTGAVYSPAVSWANLLPYSQIGVTTDGTYTGTPSMQFSFDTPIGAAGTPSVAISYVNTTSTFLQGDTADNITLTVTNSSTTATQLNLTLTITIPSGFSLNSPVVDSSGGNWQCPATTGQVSSVICTLPSALNAGAHDSVSLNFSILPTTPVGQISLSAALSNGGLNNSQQCGRVLYNDYHVEPPKATQSGAVYSQNKICPNQTSLSNVQKFLEYSLYNLSNFVTPSTTDLITIEGTPTVAWTPTPNSIPYGTALPATIFDATATDTDTSSAVPGSFVYSYNGTTIATGYSTLPGGTDTLSAAFTLSNTTDYVAPTPNPITTILQVTPDSTTTTLTGVVSPIFYGQIIAQLAPENAISNGPAALDGLGSLNFYINGTLACSIQWNITPQPICPATTGAGYDATPASNPYIVYSAFVEPATDLDFSGSQSATSSVVVNPDITTGVLTASATTSTPNQPVTFTATFVGNYATPSTGTVTFLDGANVIGTSPINASGVATLTVSSLIVGAHNITASFVAPNASQGIPDFLPATTASVLVIITFPPTITPTVTTLTSSDNPSVVGQSVAFTATVATTGAFITVPTGSVTFIDGTNTPLSTVNLDATGTAIYTTSTLTAGLHNITAFYAGTTNLATSTSPIVPQQVNTSITSAGTGFILTVTPTTLSVGAGSSVAVSVTVTELENFNQPVQLTCTGMPSEATCAFDTSLIPAEGGTTRLVITPSAPHNCNSTTPYFVAQGGRSGLTLFAFASMLLLARRRRMLKGIALAAAICLIPALSGCSGTCTDLGTKPGIYTFTVTGTSVPVTVVTGPGINNPPVTHSQTMTVTVTI